MAETDEVQLLRSAAAGDERAFEALYRLYEQRVRLAAWRFCHRADWIDDLANESWCRAYNNRSTYDSARPFLTWVVGILHNVWREHLRDLGTSPHAATGGAADGSGSPADYLSDEPDPEVVAADAELLAALNDCVDRLEPEERDLVRWRFFEGQSLRAVAQRLAIAEATVREVRLPQVIAKIQRCLRAKGLEKNLDFSSRASGGDSAIQGWRFGMTRNRNGIDGWLNELGEARSVGMFDSRQAGAPFPWQAAREPAAVCGTVTASRSGRRLGWGFAVAASVALALVAVWRLEGGRVNPTAPMSGDNIMLAANDGALTTATATTVIQTRRSLDINGDGVVDGDDIQPFISGWAQKSKVQVGTRDASDLTRQLLGL